MPGRDKIQNTDGMPGERLRRTPTVGWAIVMSETRFGNAMLLLLGLMVIVLTLVNCSWTGPNRHSFDGVYFDSKIKSEHRDPAQFILTLRDPGQSVEGAPDAAIYAATRYCIDALGTSRVTWQTEPEDAVEALDPAASDLVLEGRCFDL